MNTEEKTKVANTIKKFRKEKGLTQECLANRLHVSRQTVSSWEVGNSEPDIKMLTALCEILDVSPNKLICSIKTETTNKFKQMPDRDCFGKLKYMLQEVKPGYHRITREDMTELCIPEQYRNMDDTTYYRIILKLKEEGYQLIDVGRYAFSVLIENPEREKRFVSQLEGFSNTVLFEDLYRIKDEDAEELYAIMEKHIRTKRIGETEDKLYSWRSIGERDLSGKGYGKSIDECKKQAEMADHNIFEITDSKGYSVYKTPHFDEICRISFFSVILKHEIKIIEQQNGHVRYREFVPETDYEVLSDGTLKTYPENLLQIIQDIKEMSLEVDQPQETKYGTLVRINLFEEERYE